MALGRPRPRRRLTNRPPPLLEPDRVPGGDEPERRLVVERDSDGTSEAMEDTQDTMLDAVDLRHGSRACAGDEHAPPVASAVQIGSAFLRCPEAGVHPEWAEALACVAPEDTIVTSVFSGRAGRSVATDYVLAAIADEAPPPAPYPVQRGLTAAMRAQAAQTGDVQRMQAWAGQSCGSAAPSPLADWYPHVGGSSGSARRGPREGIEVGGDLDPP